MTTQMSELEMILDIETLDDDDDDHFVCGSCYTGYDPGRVVTAICGARIRDCEPIEECVPSDSECDRCTVIKFCPECGSDLYA
jgi:hypothetical protein